jgi:isopentenyl diphosphate isomerase/L-lactate dehydrogenase-like FMN-dependent dehydrogenase
MKLGNDMEYVEIIENGRRRIKELGIYDRYFTKGAESGATLRINREFFDTMRFRFNVIDSLPASTETEIFGCKLETPIMSAALSAGAELQKITDSPLVMLVLIS